jgi:hypothetical protein
MVEMDPKPQILTLSDRPPDMVEMDPKPQILTLSDRPFRIAHTRCQKLSGIERCPLKSDP